MDAAQAGGAADSVASTQSAPQRPTPGWTLARKRAPRVAARNAGSRGVQPCGSSETQPAGDSGARPAVQHNGWLRQPSAVAQANAQEEPRGTRHNWPPDGKAEDGAGGQPERGYACPAARQPRRWLSGVPRCWCVAPAAGHTVAMLHQFGSGATACANSTRATVVSWRAATRYPSRRNWARRSRSRSRVSASTRIEICRRGPA